MEGLLLKHGFQLKEDKKYENGFYQIDLKDNEVPIVIKYCEQSKNLISTETFFNLVCFKKYINKTF